MQFPSMLSKSTQFWLYKAVQNQLHPTVSGMPCRQPQLFQPVLTQTKRIHSTYGKGSRSTDENTYTCTYISGRVFSMETRIVFIIIRCCRCLVDVAHQVNGHRICEWVCVIAFAPLACRVATYAYVDVCVCLSCICSGLHTLTYESEHRRKPATLSSAWRHQHAGVHRRERGAHSGSPNGSSILFLLLSMRRTGDECVCVVEQ